MSDKQSSEAGIARFIVRLQKIGTYGLVALLGLILDFSVVFISKEYLNLHYLLAICVGFLAGLICTFVLSNRFVFGQAKMKKHTAFILFAFIGIVGLLILNGLVWFMTGVLGIYYLLAKAVATIFVFFWNYIARSKLYYGDE